jgi:hypothetical protein
MMRRRYLLLIAVVALTFEACGGRTVLVKVTNPFAAESENGSANQGPVLSQGGNQAVNVDSSGGGGSSTNIRKGGSTTTGPDLSKCAIDSNPAEGFTKDSIKFGTIIPLSGAVGPLGEQTARVMKTASQVWLNSIPNIPGPYAGINWGCPTRPGIFGRKVSLTIYSLNDQTDTGALAGMQRLIAQEHVFLVRDCYLQTNLMGSMKPGHESGAVKYQNENKVPGVWCFSSNDDLPALAPWNFAPGVDPDNIAAIHTAYLINNLHKSQLAIVEDPSVHTTMEVVAKNVNRQLLKKEIPDSCIVQTQAQTTEQGMSSQMAAIRGCYGNGTQPDAVLAFDVFNAAFGAIDANKQGFNPQWACTTCWVRAIAELCGAACTGMVTDCQALPCIPWADHTKYPAAKALDDTRLQYFANDPIDILTYGPAAITGGLGLWLGKVGLNAIEKTGHPNLSRAALRDYLENGIKNWDAGIGPLLTTSPSDHFGGKSIWLMRFTGANKGGPSPWFADNPDTHEFVPFSQVCPGCPASLTTNNP